MEKTLFQQIVDHDIDADIVYQDELVTAFSDLYPVAPVHILLVPNIIIPTINDIKKEDEVRLGHLFSVAKTLAKKYGIEESGYRLVVNCNEDAGQSVFHLHMHLLGGTQLGKMCSKE